MIQVQPASFLSWFLPLNAWRKTVQSNDRDTFPALYSMPLAPDFLLHAHTILNNGQQHYRTRVLCRVSQTLGKGRKTIGNFLAECSTQRSAHGLSSTGEAGFAECLFSGTRQTFAVCQAALGKKSWNGTDEQANWRTEQANGTNGTGSKTLPSARRVALGKDSKTSPSAELAALGEVWVFAECHVSGTRQSFKLRRVPK